MDNRFMMIKLLLDIVYATGYTYTVNVKGSMIMDSTVINAIRSIRKSDKVNGNGTYDQDRPIDITIYFSLEKGNDIYQRITEKSFYNLALHYDNTLNILSSIQANYRYVTPYYEVLNVPEESSYILLSSFGIPIPNSAILELEEKTQ